MGKAIYGLYGGIDPRTQAELLGLRARVRELEAELAELRATPAALAGQDLERALVAPDLHLELLTSAESALV